MFYWLYSFLYLQTTYTDKGPKVSKSFFRLNGAIQLICLMHGWFQLFYVLFFSSSIALLRSFVSFDWNTLASWWQVHCIWSHYILRGQCEASSQLLHNSIGFRAVSIPRIGDGQSPIRQTRGETEQSMYLKQFQCSFEFLAESETQNSGKNSVSKLCWQVRIKRHLIAFSDCFRVRFGVRSVRHSDWKSFGETRRWCQGCCFRSRRFGLYRKGEQFEWIFCRCQNDLYLRLKTTAISTSASERTRCDFRAWHMVRERWIR